MKQNDIKIQIDKFEKNKTSSHHRYYSFDFCYNYFYKKQNSGIDLEKDCLQLGYSWLAGVCFAVVHFYFKQILRTIKKLLNL